MKKLKIGKQFNFQWSPDDFLDPDGNPLADKVNIDLSRNLTTYTNLVSATDNDGSYVWTVTGPETTSGTFKLSDSSDLTISAVSNQFIITSESVGTSLDISATYNGQTIRAMAYNANGSQINILEIDSSGNLKVLTDTLSIKEATRTIATNVVVN